MTTISGSGISFPSGQDIALGPVIQAKFARTTGAAIASLASTDFIEVISLEFTPKLPNSIIQVGGLIHLSGTYVWGISPWLTTQAPDITFDGPLVSNSEPNSNTANSATTGYIGDITTNGQFVPETVMGIHRNYSSTNPRTYGIRWIQIWNGANTYGGVAQNRGSLDMATPSYMYVWEHEQKDQQRSLFNGVEV